jgi:hypothetical protein
MIPPFLIKPIIYLAIIATIASVSFYKGFSYAESTYNEANVIQAKENAKALAKAIAETETKTRAIYERQIRNLKKVSSLTDTCLLSPGFRQLYDASIGMPESATAQPVAVKALADTIIENHSACLQNAAWLEECNRICK